MRIGIITVHKSTVNYGASLQCYSLYRYLLNLGHVCEVIDLKRPCHDSYIPSKSFGESRNIFLKFKNRLYGFLRFRNKRARQRCFDDFNNLIRYSREYRSVDSIYNNPPIYDVYISGSDQIWNPNMPFVNAPYFLDFIHGVKKISYASSLGVDRIDKEETRKNIFTWLSEYTAISVREKSAKKLLNSLSINNVTQVLDPVFLTTKAEWESLIPTKRFEQNNYSFAYFLSYDENNVRIIDSYIKKNKERVILVMSDDSNINVPGVVQIHDIGPTEWLNYLYFSKEVITDSFHAMCFSLIFEKTFGVIINKEKKTNSRIIDLLTSLHIDNCMSDITEPEIKMSSIDDNGRNILNGEIQKSKDFLISAIDN